MALIYCVTFVASLVAGLAVTRHVRNFAVAHSIAVSPSRSRDVHSLPVPRLGGVAIVAAFYLVIGCLVVAERFGWSAHVLPPNILLRIVFPATLVFLLGLYDDLYTASPWLKLAVQALAAVPIYLSGLRVISLPVLAGNHHFGSAVSFCATVLWVLLITNAFNLVDGLDGLAAGSALFSTFTMFVVALANGRMAVAVLALALAGVIAGFLRFNFNPATVFLGDSGSLFVGFVLSVLGLASMAKSSTMVAVAIPIVSFGLPIVETGLSVVRRFLNGEPLFRADRQHIHHKLLERGLSQRQAVVILYAVSAACVLLSALLLHPGGPTLGIVMFVLGGGIWVGLQHLRYPELFEITRVARRTMQQKQVIIHNLEIRRGVARLAEARDMPALHATLRDIFLSNVFDSFELRPPALAGSAALRGFDWSYRWQKPQSIQATPGAHWSLVLELRTPAGLWGEFAVFRRTRGHGLELDINLLLEEFQPALARALERLLMPAAIEISAPHVLAAAGEPMHSVREHGD